MSRHVFSLFCLAALALAACSSSGPSPATPTGTTGIAAIDSAIGRLLTKDVKALVDLVEFTPEGCVKSATVGAPPTCEPGQQEGSPVTAFPADGCSRQFLTELEDVRELIDGALARSAGVSLYAVVRSDGAQVIATTAGPATSPTLPGLLWWLNDDGKIVRLSLGCAPTYVAFMIELAIPEGVYTVGPLGTCTPGPGEAVDLVVTVDGLTGDAAIGQLYGPASTTLGASTSERAIVHVTAGTQWGGRLGSFGVVRVGVVLQVTGQRQDDCSILATSITAIETPTQAN